jgi:hypothetical protein
MRRHVSPRARRRPIGASPGLLTTGDLYRNSASNTSGIPHLFRDLASRSYEVAIRRCVSDGPPSFQGDIMSISRSTLLAQGLLAGCLGYAALAGLVSVVDVASGRSPFHTAALLGASLFYGISDPARVEVLPAYVFAYNGAHLLVFLLLGLIGASLATLADRGNQLWYLATFFFIFVAFHAIGALQAISSDMRSELSAQVIWIGGIVAATVMGAYLLRVHPRMRRTQRWDA